MVMSSAATAKYPIGCDEVCILTTCGSRIPSGSSLRAWSTAFLVSLTASLMSVPIWNSTTVWLFPSRAVELIDWTPLIERTEDSIRWVIWVMISVGAAPG